MNRFGFLLFILFSPTVAWSEMIELSCFTYEHGTWSHPDRSGKFSQYRDEGLVPVAVSIDLDASKMKVSGTILPILSGPLCDEYLEARITDRKVTATMGTCEGMVPGSSFSATVDRYSGELEINAAVFDRFGKKLLLFNSLRARCQPAQRRF